MAVRIRKNRKKIVCARFSKPRKGDCYLDDGVHYTLAVEMKVLHTADKGDTWYFKTKEEKKKYGKIKDPWNNGTL